MLHSPITALLGIAHLLHQKISKCLRDILSQEGRAGSSSKGVQSYCRQRELPTQRTYPNKVEKVLPSQLQGVILTNHLSHFQFSLRGLNSPSHKLNCNYLFINLRKLVTKPQHSLQKCKIPPICKHWTLYFWHRGQLPGFFIFEVQDLNGQFFILRHI